MLNTLCGLEGTSLHERCSLHTISGLEKSPPLIYPLQTYSFYLNKNLRVQAVQVVEHFYVLLELV